MHIEEGDVFERITIITSIRPIVVIKYIKIIIAVPYIVC